MSYATDVIEQPVVSVDNFHNNEKVLIIHSHINQKGKMILKKEEALLLLVELYKFVKEWKLWEKEWIYFNGKHYDAENPNGSDKWFELPIFKRMIKKVKINIK